MVAESAKSPPSEQILRDEPKPDEFSQRSLKCRAALVLRDLRPQPIASRVDHFQRQLQLRQRWLLDFHQRHREPTSPTLLDYSQCRPRNQQRRVPHEDRPDRQIQTFGRNSDRHAAIVVTPANAKVLASETRPLVRFTIGSVAFHQSRSTAELRDHDEQAGEEAGNQSERQIGLPRHGDLARSVDRSLRDRTIRVTERLVDFTPTQSYWAACC